MYALEHKHMRENVRGAIELSFVLQAGCKRQPNDPTCPTALSTLASKETLKLVNFAGGSNGTQRRSNLSDAPGRTDLMDRKPLLHPLHACCCAKMPRDSGITPQDQESNQGAHGMRLAPRGPGLGLVATARNTERNG